MLTQNLKSQGVNDIKMTEQPSNYSYEDVKCREWCRRCSQKEKKFKIYQDYLIIGSFLVLFLVNCLLFSLAFCYVDACL